MGDAEVLGGPRAGGKIDPLSCFAAAPLTGGAVFCEPELAVDLEVPAVLNAGFF